MNVRRPVRAIDHGSIRNMIEAAHFAEKIGHPLNASITLHPSRLTPAPTEPGACFGEFTNRLRIWCTRRFGGYFAVWSRENFEGSGREHLHVLLYVRPARGDSHLNALNDALHRWYPSESAVELATTPIRRERVLPDGSRFTAHPGLTYIAKQMTPQAWWALGKRIRRQATGRDGAKVAAVLGKRCGVSRSLDRRARAAWATRPSKPAMAIPGEDEAQSTASCQMIAKKDAA